MRDEETMKSIYYEDHYYKIPDDYADFGEFVRKTDFSKPIALVEYRQKTCWAPYFTEESCADVMIMIEYPEFLIQAQGFLMRQKDYDAQLSALVSTNCPGCLRYGDDPENLDGHYDEMSLDGTCFEKDVEKEFFFHYGFEHFWAMFKHNQKKIESWIDQGKIAFAEKKVTSLLFMMTSSRIFLRKTGEIYHFYVTDFGSPVGRLFIEYMIKIGLSTSIEGWVLHPFIDRDNFKRIHRLNRDPLKKSPPHLLPMPMDWIGTKEKALFVIVHGYQDNPRLSEEAYLYFVELIGEDRLYKILADLYYIDDEGFDLFNHTYMLNTKSVDKELFHDREQLDELIAYNEAIDARLRQPYPDFLSQTLGPTWDLNEVLPEFSGIESVESKIPVLDEERLFGAVKFIVLLDQTHIITGTIKIRLNAHAEESKRTLAYIRRILGKTLVDSFYGMPFSEYYYRDAVEFNYLVMNSRLMRKAIRNLSPLLNRFNASYREYVTGEETYFQMDYCFLPFSESDV